MFVASVWWYLFTLSLANGQLLDLTKRQQDSTAVENPFSLITPSTVLQWSPCYENSSASLIGDVSCARIIAPLDYTNLSLGTMQLAIFKLGGSGRNKDAVFFNTGGPGDDPVDFVLSRAALLRTQIGNDTDIIAVVPRGVSSTFPPITCDSSDLAAARSLWEIESTQPGYNRLSIAESYAIGKSFRLDCGLVTPDLIPYVGTVYAAHDMDFVRQALGQEKLSYLGYSYGSVLGGTYAALFPSRVGRMVLDGVLDFNDYYSARKDPSLDIGDAELGLDTFFQACHNAGPENCVLWSKTTEEIRKTFLKADQRLLEEPFPIAGQGLLKWPIWRSGVYNALYRPAQGFPLVAGVAAEVLKGTAGPAIQAYVDLLQNEASSSGAALVDSRTGLKNSPNAGQLISCSDSGAVPEELGVKELDATFAKYRKVSKFFAGVSSQYVFICLGAKLSAKMRYTDKFNNITTSNPILFVGNTADPTTPLRNAHRMSNAFPGSRVLTINGTGHISYNAARDNRCATAWIMPYFRDGTLPPEGTVCDGRQSLFGASDD